MFSVCGQLRPWDGRLQPARSLLRVAPLPRPSPPPRIASLSTPSTMQMKRSVSRALSGLGEAPRTLLAATLRAFSPLLRPHLWSTFSSAGGGTKCSRNTRTQTRWWPAAAHAPRFFSIPSRWTRPRGSRRTATALAASRARLAWDSRSRPLQARTFTLTKRTTTSRARRAARTRASPRTAL